MLDHINTSNLLSDSQTELSLPHANSLNKKHVTLIIVGVCLIYVILLMTAVGVPNNNVSFQLISMVFVAYAVLRLASCLVPKFHSRSSYLA